MTALAQDVQVIEPFDNRQLRMGNQRAESFSHLRRSFRILRPIEKKCRTTDLARHSAQILAHHANKNGSHLPRITVICASVTVTQALKARSLRVQSFRRFERQYS